jgi:hypothetical protein
VVKRVALGLVAALAALAAVVALQPAAFTVERSLAIAAPADVVQAHIQDLRAMDAWSPWVAMDPQMKIAYAGPPAGVGARSSWEGPQMGKGRLTVTAVEPGREVEMQLEMIEPMPATNRIFFTLAEAGGATNVTWRMEGRNGFVGKALALVMDMDEMVGGPFEQGLASLRRVAEADAAKRRAGPLAARAAAAAAPQTEP